MSTALDIDGLVKAAEVAISAARTTEAIRQVATEVGGKRSPLAEAHRALGALEPEARKELGRLLHEARTTIDALVERRRTEIRFAEMQATMESDRIDLSEFIPGTVRSSPTRGHLHLVSQTRDALEDVFVGMGFEVAEGPDIETDWFNFGALNIPPAHPARGMWDTFYPQPGDSRVHPAPDPHVAGTDSSDGSRSGEWRSAHPRRHARALLSAGYARCAPSAGLSPNRRTGGGQGHHLRRPGRNHRGIHYRILRLRHPLAAAPGILPLHRAIG